MQDCPHDRQEEAQTAVYGTSLQVLRRWALHLPSLLQNLLQAGRQQVHHVVWPGQAAAGQARRLGYKRAISLAVCCKALKLAKVPAAMLAAFEDIRSRPNSMTVLAFPDHVLAPYAQPSPNPVQLQMTTPFPVTLPTCQLPATYKQRHGLHAVNKHLAHRAPFSQQLAEYKAWCTNPIQLDRPSRKHSSSTWQNSEKHIFLYLGYSHHYHQVSLPTMQLFLSTPLICHYVSFHIAAEHSHLTSRNFLSCAKRVLVADQTWREASQSGGGSAVVANNE